MNNLVSNPSFKDITYPTDFEYSSDGLFLPVEFYLNAVPKSSEILLKLGYFSSNAINVLAYGFARFIYYGGRIKIVSNHFMYDKDLELLDDGVDASESDHLLNNLEWLKKSLSSEGRHFLSCLKYLVKHNRLQIVPVLLKPNNMAHYKQGLFTDQSGNQIYIDGSCNFTGSGLLKNGESLKVFRSWGSEYETKTIQGKQEHIESILNKKNEKYKYLSSNEILNAIQTLGKDKTMSDLLEDELDLVSKCSLSDRVNYIMDDAEKEITAELENIKEMPKFPYEEGPRDYQISATDKWKENNKQGLFAMATGTGKTMTALNCLLEDWKEEGCYQAVILVPTKELVEQWSAELTKFNFNSVIQAYSSNSQWKQQVRSLLTRLKFEANASFVIICTYKGFTGEFWLKSADKLPTSTCFIADEAHNSASPMMQELLEKIKFKKRLALSATPNRRFDDEGNEKTYSFFNSWPPHTFEYPMEKAIEKEVLCSYRYYPHIVYLTEEELEEYKKISTELSKYFSTDKQIFKQNERVKILLLERKRIIHKAHNKLSKFKVIIEERKAAYGSSLKYTLVYVPEGSDERGTPLIDLYEVAFRGYEAFSCPQKYTAKSSGKKEILDRFERGNIGVLFAMKCLDEGVDIPRTECAIFCSSTGNPRQFVQRRGRVLRQHPEKQEAVIHDLIVVPSVSGSGGSAVEKNMMKQELERVVYFGSLATNYYEAMHTCRQVAEQYGLNMFALEESLRNPNE